MSYERNETALRAVARPKHLAYEDTFAEGVLLFQAQH